MWPVREYVETMMRLHPQLAGQQYWSWLASAGVQFSQLDRLHSTRLRKDYHCRNGDCFYNCQKIVLDDPTYRYFEGIAFCIIPMPHAWLVQDGKVIDPTWQGVETEPDYFGVEIPRESIRSHWLRTQTAGELLPAHWQQTQGSAHPSAEVVAAKP